MRFAWCSFFKITIHIVLLKLVKNVAMWPVLWAFIVCHASMFQMPWTLHVRKEVFRPDERLENPVALHLIYCQIISDVYDSRCVRISEDQRIKMKRLIGELLVIFTTMGVDRLINGDIYNNECWWVSYWWYLQQWVCPHLWRS